MPDVITIGYFIVEITDLLRGIPVCLRLVNRLLQVSKFEKTHGKFLVHGGDLIEIEVVVNLLSDGLPNTSELHSIFTTGDLVRKIVDGITSLGVCIALEIVFSPVVGELVDLKQHQDQEIYSRTLSLMMNLIN